MKALEKIIGRNRSIFYEDLRQITSTLDKIVSKSTFLVLGGAGSVGQAVSKEIIKRNPIALHVVDINENNQSSVVNLKIVSHWADFDKESGRRTNNISQQRFFSSDVGFDFASEMVQDIKWGKG